MASSARPPVEIEALIDAGRWSARQKWSALLGGLAVLVDGFDNQLLGLAVPIMAADWQVSPASFAPALSAGLVGMLIGNGAGGAVGDRIGRKNALLVSMTLFGVVTLAIAALDSLSALLVCRFVAGIGLGAAVPNASALVAELTPRRSRTLVVTLSTLCSPLGGVVAGLVASLVLSDGSWRWLFIGGGIAPLVHVGISLLFLPESPQHLATRRGGADTMLRKSLGGMGLVVEEGASFASAARGREGGAFQVVLAPAWRRDTLLLWGASFANMMALYMLLNWLPATLAEAGYAAAQASLSISSFSFGGIVGSVIAAWFMQRFGSRLTLALMAVAAAVLGLGLAFSVLGGGLSQGILIALLAALGLFGGAFNVVLFPLALHLYPPTARAGGLGIALALGRSGAAISPFVAVAAVQAFGSSGLFAGYAALMLLAAAAIAPINRHLEPVGRAGARQE